jgi:hypothetical protein
MVKSLLVVLLIGCARAPAAAPGRASSRLATITATGDGITDDRAALQAAIDLGGTLVLADGTYIVGAKLLVTAPVTIRGASRDGVVLLQAPGIPGGVRILDVESPGVTISDLTLDGNKALQTPDEHRAGVFALNAPSIVIRNVVARNFTGDGLYLYNGEDGAVIDHVLVTGNDRNGITLGGTMTGVSITNSTFAGSHAQQIDSEAPAGHQDDVTIIGCVIDGVGISTDYALTVSGSSTAMRSKNWLVQGNTINGGVLVVWADGARVVGNHGVNPTALSSVRVYRTSEDTTISDNDLTATIATVGVISVSGTSGGPPRHTRIVGNTLHSRATAPSVGISVQGAASVEIADNTITGSGLAGGSLGVYLRATLTDPAMAWDYALVERNRLSGWGATAIAVWGNGAAPLGRLSIVDNVFDDWTGTTTVALSLNADGTGAARIVEVSGNLMLGGVTTLVGASPAGIHSAMPSGERWAPP